MLTSADEFIELAERSNSAAGDRDCRLETAPESLWFEILDRHPDYHAAVAMNRNLPDGVIRRLSRDPESRVRILIAMKRRLPLDVRKTLAVDAHEGVRHSIAMNAKTPPDILKQLSEDPMEFVAAAARSRLSEPENGTRPENGTSQNSL